MNRSVPSILFLACAAGVARASSSPADDWLSLDREIASLAQSTSPAQEGEKKGIKVSGYVKTQYDHSGDERYQPEPGTDLSGVGFEGLRVTFSGEIEGYELKLSIDGKDGTFKLKDGYVRFALAESIHAQMGQFKSRFLFSAFASDEKLNTYRRTFLGNAYGERDPGLQLDAQFGPLIAVAQAQNGDDEAGDEWALTGKLILAAMGQALEKQAGGFGPEAETALTFGLGYFDDGAIDNTSALSAEAMFTSGPLWAHAEISDQDDGFTGLTGGPAKKAGSLSDTTPWTATLAFALSEQFELVGRYEDEDDSDDTTTVLAGVNYYVNGHALKWQLNYATTDSDDPEQDGDLFTLGLFVAV